MYQSTKIAQEVLKSQETFNLKSSVCERNQPNTEYKILSQLTQIQHQINALTHRKKPSIHTPSTPNKVIQIANNSEFTKRLLSATHEESES